MTADVNVTEKVARALWEAETEYDYAWEPNADTYRDAARNLLAVLSDPEVLAGIAGVLREHGEVSERRTVKGPYTVYDKECAACGHDLARDDWRSDIVTHQATALADWIRGQG